MSQPIRPTRFEVDLEAVRHNVRVLRASVHGAMLCAVVKADGYGHGAVAVARAVLEAGAEWLAVALVEEGAELRRAGIDAPVLLLAEPPVPAATEVLRHGLIPTIYTSAFAHALQQDGRRVQAHLKVDTGMARVGARSDNWPHLLDDVNRLDRIEVDGIWTHLARADEPALPTTDEQLDAFDERLAEARDRGMDPAHIHAANSAAALLHARSRHTMVRTGIAVYGLSPGPEVDAADHGLHPVGRLITEIAFVKHVRAGTPVSYGHRWRAPADGFVATLPVGYADGLPRALTNRANVLHAGQRRPVVGTVTMDQVLVWFGGDEPGPGDEVVLFGEQDGQQIRAESWAATLDTITYEVTTRISARVPRIVTTP